MKDIYIVLIVCVIIWGGLFGYLISIDSQLRKLKKKIEFKKESH